MSNKTNIPFVIKTGGSISLFLKSGAETVAIDHPNYSKIVDALKKGEHDKIENLINIAKAVTNYGRGKITVNNGQVFFAGQAVHNTLTERIIKMMAEGFKVDHMLLFLSNLMSNPSFRAVNETYTFLENHGLPITEDGCFLGYKAVRNNYTDLRTGTFNNNVGQTVQMERNKVNENYHEDCSYGLHVGSLGYVIDFGAFRRGQAVPETGNRLLIVKVNPKDVVSVPEYAGHTKMRVCQYVVVDEIKDVVKELDKVSVYKADATPATPDNDWDEEDSDTEDECVCDTCSTTGEIDTTSPWNEAAYRAGFTVGESDRNNFNEYGENRDYSRENSYRIGYNDGYNNRPNQAANDVPSSDEDADESEYEAGYELGYDDAAQGLSYQYNLEVDSTDAFKDGYRDGYNDAK
jgi:hypothetical protein